MSEDKLEALSKTIRTSIENVESGYKKNTHYSLDGRVLKTDGSISKTDYFGFLDIPLDDYSDIILTRDEAESFRRHIQAMSTGLQAAVPLTCPGKEKCKFSDRCPLAQVDKAPVGRQCLPEVELISFWRKRYIEEYDVNPHSMTDLGMVNELAELDVYDMRASMLLASEDGHGMIQEDAVGATNAGTQIFQKRVHVAWELKERIKVRRLKVLEALVGTRKEKYKRAAALKTRDVTDPSSKMSLLREKLEGLNDEVEATKVEMAEDITPEPQEESPFD